MKRNKMIEETAMRTVEDVVYEFTTALQPLVSDQPDPYNPHIDEFSEQIYVLVCEMRRVKEISQ